MKIRIALSLVLAFITLTIKAQYTYTPPSLTIGSSAPALEVQQWLKGTPVKQFEKGHIYVVEFWATWCGPCIGAMPHLSELARKYRGKVTVIGVSVWEGKRKPIHDAAALQSFVDKKGKDMDYTVAMDNLATNKVADAWLKAANAGGIPTTFLIDRTGKIAWIGTPDLLDNNLEAQVSTPERFDFTAAKEHHAKIDKGSISGKGLKVVFNFLKEKNYGQAWQEMQKIVKENPWFETENSSDYVRAYLNYNSRAAMAYVLEKSKDAEFLKAKGAKNNVGATGEEMLDEFARMVVGQPGLNANLYFMAIERLKKAVNAKPDEYSLLQQLARGYANLGEFAKAATAQEKAIETYMAAQQNRQPVADQSKVSQLIENEKNKDVKEALKAFITAQQNGQSAGGQFVLLSEKQKKAMEETLTTYNALKKKKEGL